MHLGAKEVDLPVSSTVRHSEKQVFGGWDMLRCFLGENVSLSLEPGEEFHANEVWDTRKKNNGNGARAGAEWALHNGAGTLKQSVSAWHFVPVPVLLNVDGIIIGAQLHNELR